MKDLSYQIYLDNAKNQFEEKWNSQSNNSNTTTTLSDFERIRTLGKGGFGRVVFVQHKQTGQYHAMKILEKEKIIKSREVQHTLNEKKILQCINFPFLVHMQDYFKDNSYLYLILEYVPGGDMFHYLNNISEFGESAARFYAAQIVLTFEYLHHLNIIYRDLKPENLTIDSTGYIKFVDFGFAKRVSITTKSFCGTIHYLAPEIILRKKYKRSADWWSLGVLIYEMVSGGVPFMGQNRKSTCDRIIAGNYEMRENFTPELQDLIKNLLQPNPAERYGTVKNGVRKIKNHPWFSSTNWIDILHKNIKAPFIPSCDGPQDTRHFEIWNEEDLKISMTEKYANEFADF